MMHTLFVFFTFIFNQGRTSDTSVAESGSDIDDPCSSLGRRSSTFRPLDAVNEEVSFTVST